MASSGTRLFKNIKIIEFINDAYRYVNKIPSQLVKDDYDSALFSLNLILSSWLNDGTNLFTISRNNILVLKPNKIEYELSSDIIDILEVSTRTSNRLLGGTAFSSSGDADNAFDSDPTTACIQNAINGYIGYDFGEDVTQSVTFFALQSNVTRDYTISVQSSDDNVTWTSFLDIPLTNYIAGETQWFNVSNIQNKRYFRILETGGSILNINECYFLGNVNDLIMMPESRSNYTCYVQKYTTGRPSMYVFNRETSQSINIWPAPDDQYPILMYNCTLPVEDVSLLKDNFSIPLSFFATLRDGLVLELTSKFLPNLIPTKFLPNLIPIRKSIYDESLLKAGMSNTEKNIPVRINLNMDKYK